MDRPHFGRRRWAALAAAATSGGLAASFFLVRPVRGGEWWLVAALVVGLIGASALVVFRDSAATWRAERSAAFAAVVLAPLVGSTLGGIVGMLAWLDLGLRPTDDFPLRDLVAGIAASAVLGALFGALVVPLVTIPIAVVGAALGAASGWGVRRRRTARTAAPPFHRPPDPGGSPRS
jgi:hypothetical protein